MPVAEEPLRFDGRVALVTGSTRGIGRAIAGTLGSLYKGVPRHRVAADLLWVLNSFPPRALGDVVRSRALAR